MSTTQALTLLSEANYGFVGQDGDFLDSTIDRKYHMLSVDPTAGNGVGLKSHVQSWAHWSWYAFVDLSYRLKHSHLPPTDSILYSSM